MRRRIELVGWVGMLAVIVFMNGNGKKAISAQEATPAVKKHFLQLGKTYEFSNGGLGMISGKISEEPTDNWVKTESVTDGKKDIVWINLNLVASIEQKKGAD
jgi:hypothetical protein